MPEHIDLDNFEVLSKIDKDGMLESVEKFADQIDIAVEAAEKAPTPELGIIKNMVISGLGGSAIGGDIFRSYLSDSVGFPIMVNRNYTLPKFVGSETLVVASSYSGNTEETLSAYKYAVESGAKVVAITSGGTLAKLAKEDNVPTLVIPGGLQPRAALGYSFFGLLAWFSKLGIIPNQDESISATGAVVKKVINEYKQSVSTNSNPAKQLALSMFDRYVYVYASQDRFDVVALRWRGQMNENGKVPASSNVVPELCHNEIVGWVKSADILGRSIVIYLRDKEDHPRISLRFDAIKPLLEEKGAEIHEIHSEGDNVLARIFSLIILGDIVSVYVALKQEIDPTPVEPIVKLKEELAKSDVGQ